MVSEEEMRKIMRGVRCIGPYNAGVKEAAQIRAEAMKEGVVWHELAVGVGGINRTEFQGQSGSTYRIPEGILDEEEDGKEYHVTVTEVSANDQP